MDIEFAGACDREEIEALYNLVFSGEEEYASYYHNNFWRAERCLVVRENGKIISMVNLMDQEMTLGEEVYKATYIFAAATHPDHRGKGLMGKMLENSFELGRKWGKDLSILITENDSLFDFYKRFGYQPVFGVSKTEISEEPPVYMCKARILDIGDESRMKKVYDCFSQGRLKIERSEERFRQILGEYEGRAYGLFDQSGENMIAYCLMDEAHMRAAEVIGMGCGYLLYICCASPEGHGCGLPELENSRPIGCALPLSERGAAVLDKGVYPPYINILFN